MNIWHDIDPAMIKPDNFSALIEIPKGSASTSLTNAPESSALTGCFTPRRIILRIMDLSRAPSPTTVTLLTCLSSAQSQSIP